MSLGNNISIITFTLFPVTIRKMCLQYNCKMISHIIYFYPFISQVFLDVALNPFGLKQSVNFKKYTISFYSQNNASLDKVGKDVIPIWQMSKARQRQVKYLLKVIQGVD